MKILVTGCFGFIGFNFINYIFNNHKEEFKVIGIDNLTTNYSKINSKNFIHKNFEFLNIDINEIEDSSKTIYTDIDLIINFAAESHVDTSIYQPEKFIYSNVLGVQRLLQFAYKNKDQNFIHISTDEVYGSSKDKFFSENSILNPSSPYSASKASADMLVNSYKKTFGMDIAILRPANNYGSFQQPEKLIPYSISRLFKNEKIQIYGKGENIRHWLFVEDTVRGILNLIEKGSDGEIYNIGSGEYFSNNYIATKLLEISNNSEDMIEYIEDRPGHDYRYAADFSKILQTGWQLETKFEEGLEKTYKWYFDNKDWLFADIENILENRKKRFVD